MLVTSVDVERVFSEGCIILNHLQSSMRPPTFCVLICLRDWIAVGVINEKDICQAINGLPDMKEGEVEDYELGWDHISTLQ